MVSVADYKDGMLPDPALPHMIVSQESLNNLQTHISLPCKTSSESEKGDPFSMSALKHTHHQKQIQDLFLGRQSGLYQEN